MKYDVIFLHPPAIYDFRKRIIFPGPIAETIRESTSQFIIFPVGLLSMAEYLERYGCRVKIFNLGEEMISDPNYDDQRFIEKTESDIYAIDLHWCTHAHGSIEIARLCKKFHPSSLIVLGGLTATCFHTEIIKKFPFIDVVLRGESEKAILQLIDNLADSRKIREVGNATYRGNDGKIFVNSLIEPCKDLDEFEFTRFDLVAPKDLSITTRIPEKMISWNIPICRGCTQSCVTCGGSAYSYLTLCGREKPAFRSPTKICEDLQKLKEQGFEHVFLSQDPRIGGKSYQSELFRSFAKEKIDISLTMELFNPANDSFLRNLRRIKTNVSLTISPESGVGRVRRFHGRKYTNDEIFTTMKLCRKFNVRLSIFFMIGLSKETWRTLNDAWKFIETICKVDRETRVGEKEQLYPYPFWFNFMFGPMILLDPGSLAFDFPKRYGYELFFSNFEDYYNGLTMPSWHQWISYRTRFLSRMDIAEMTLRSLEFMWRVKDKYCIFGGRPDRLLDKAILSSILFDISSNRVIIREVDNIMSLHNPIEKEERLKILREILSEFSSRPWLRKEIYDPIGYKEKFEKIARESMPLLSCY